MSKEKEARIKVIQLSQAQQVKSSCSETRKDRLLTALFRDRAKFCTIVDIYRGLLAKFEHYVKLFQSEKPTLHKLHAEMFQVTQKIATLFLKRELIPEANVKKLLQLKSQLSKRENQLGARHLCVGDPQTSHWAKDVAKKLRTGYEQTLTFLLDKLPLKNGTITHLSCLDPSAFKDTSTLTSFKALAKSLPNVVDSNELGLLDGEVRDFTVDTRVEKLASSYNCDSGRIDTDFWSKVFALKRDQPSYPVLSKLVKALLSIFSGPLVEASFNLMDDCIRSDRARLGVENYEATAVVKSTLRSRGEKASSFTINKSMITYIKTSKGRYYKEMERRKQLQKKQQERRIMAAVAKLGPKSSTGRMGVKSGSSQPTRAHAPGTFAFILIFFFI